MQASSVSFEATIHALRADPRVGNDPVAHELALLLAVPPGRTSRGYAYLQEPAWVRFRDWLPHTLGNGARVLDAVSRVVAAATALPPEAQQRVNDAAAVVQRVVFTAAVTAPPDLWLLRHVLGAFHSLGLSQRLCAGEVLHPERAAPLRADELRVDLRFLVSRGLLQCKGDGFRLADHAAAHAAFAELLPISPALPSSLAGAWLDVMHGSAPAATVEALGALHEKPLPSDTRAPGRFSPSPRDVELGFLLVPLVLALRAAHRIDALLKADLVTDALLAPHAQLGAHAAALFAQCGMMGADRRLSAVGQRVLARGPGPFGIIETYHAYVRQLDALLHKGRGAVWVERGGNVAASQDANRRTFLDANAALDRFCDDTGFAYHVFVEHALGKGEATRQRMGGTRVGPPLAYVGADLEDAAIDAAIAEQHKGLLPPDMLFVRNADIGRADVLLHALGAHGLNARGAVMIVGNGFHEVRDQTDARMISVLRGYAEAGVVLLFTEETGLSVSDLLETAWNTYHAGFKYVHERSGQGLRPAEKRPPSPLEATPPLSWSECAEAAGYVRLDAYSPRGRTVYPYTPASGHNPAISVTHFCVPKDVFAALPRPPRAHGVEERSAGFALPTGAHPHPKT